MNRRQFAEEFVLNLQNQGFKLSYDYIEMFEGIYLEYLYKFCPYYAIIIDPKIIDITRKYAKENPLQI